MHPNHSQYVHPVVIPTKAGIQLAPRFETEIDGKIAPLRIVFLYQPEFPAAVPFLDPLFLLDRVFHRRVHFKPDQKLDPITGAESVKVVAAVLGDALDQVRSCAGLERAVAR